MLSEYSWEQPFLNAHDLNSGASTSWPAMDQQSQDISVIAGANSASTNVFACVSIREHLYVRQFDANSGSVVADYDLGSCSAVTTAVTPNGRLLYANSTTTAPSYHVGIVGASTLKIESHPPIAAFTTTPYSSQTFLFDGSSSTPSSSFDSITRAVWHFGDGTTASRLVSMHTYAQPGSYRARLTVTDIDGDVDEYVTTIVAGDTVGTASINGRVFFDTNRNGVRDTGERALKDRQVWIDLDNNGTLDGVDRQAFTTSDGSFDILRLSGGTYRLQVLTQNSELQIRPIHEWTVTLPSGARVTGRNFALASAASITGTVGFDPNGDGHSFTSIPVARRHVWIDSNNNSRIDPHEPLTRTDYTGSYTLGHLLPGTYRVRAELAPGESLLSGSAFPKAVSINGYNSARAEEMKIVPIPSASVTGIVYDDRDADETQDAGEPAAKDVGVFVLTRSGKRTAVTDANGAFAITGLLQDYFSVQVTPPRGWRSVNEYGVSISTKLNSVLGNVRVGITTKPVLRGQVIIDQNRDGVLDENPDYYGARDWTVFADVNRNGLLDSNEPSAVTFYGGGFNLLLPSRGTYDIRLVAHADYLITIEQVGLAVAAGDVKSLKMGVQYPR